MTMTSPQKPSVFEFLDAAQFLKSYFDYRKLLNPKFSLAAWSDEIGIGSKVTLRFILKKQRSISERTACVFKSNLKMTADEGLYFDNLIAYSQAKTVSQRQAFGSALLKFHKNNIDQKELPSEKASHHAFGPLILTLLTFNDLKKDAVTLAHFLMIDRSEVEQIMNQLVTDGLVLKNSDHTYLPAFSENKFRIPDNAALKSYYEYWIDRSKQALALPKETRSYRSLKFALTPDEYTEAVQKLNEYALGLLSRFQSNEFSARQLYMFESALFPVSLAMPPSRLDLGNDLE